ADHRKPAALDASKVDRRPARLIDPPLYLRRFQIWIDFLLDAHPPPASLQILHTMPQTPISHAGPSIHISAISWVLYSARHKKPWYEVILRRLLGVYHGCALRIPKSEGVRYILLH